MSELVGLMVPGGRGGSRWVGGRVQAWRGAGVVIILWHLVHRRTARDRDSGLFWFIHIVLTFKGRSDAPVILSFIISHLFSHLSTAPPLPRTLAEEFLACHVAQHGSDV